MQYKFRGKRIDNGEWIYGSYIYSPLLPFHISKHFIIEFAGIESGEPLFDWHEVITETVGMWTGLKDKNAIEIYEGDTLHGFQKEQSDKDGKNGFDITDSIYFSLGGFKVFGKCLQNGYTRDGNIIFQFMWCNPGHHATSDHYYQIDDIEIIGNIYDVNPAGGKSSDYNMNILDPKEGEVKEGTEATSQATTEAANAQESASQDQATGANESAEEGGAEG